MSKVKVNTTNTFEEWRGKTNEIGSGLGDIATLTQNAVIVYTDNIHGINDNTFVGTPATFNVTINNKATPVPIYEITIIGSGGSSYAVNDTIKILGSLVGGVDGVNDIILTVSSITTAFAIDGVTVVGTPTTDLVAEVNLLRTEAGLDTLTTTSKIFSGAINELDALQGNVSLTTTAQTVTGAILEHETDIGTVSSLTTTANNIVGATNELDALQGNVNIKGTKAASLPKSTFATITDAVKQIDEFQGNIVLTTTAQTVTGAITELDTLQGNVGLTTTAQTVTGAILEHETDIGSMSFNTSNSSIAEVVTAGDHVNLGSDITDALNSLKSRSDFTLDTLGGKLGTVSGTNDYDGGEATIIAALNSLYDASSLSTLDNTYLKRNGGLDMTGILKLDELGIVTSDSTKPMLFKVGSATANTRIYIATDGKVGIGKIPTLAKLDVSGSFNATSHLLNGNNIDSRYLRLSDVTNKLSVSNKVNFTSDLEYKSVNTDDRYLRISAGSGQTVQNDTTFTGTVKVEDPLYINSALYIGSTLVANNTLSITEWTQDRIGEVFTGNQLSGGISSTYNDATGKITLDIADNLHNHVSANITDWAEAVQDTTGAMVTGNTENGLVVTYNDTIGKLNFNVNDPVLSISGDATGSKMMTNLGNTNIVITLNEESVEDIVGAMVSSNTETGISVTYQDGDGTLDFALTADPIVKLTGDASGQVTLTNLASSTFSIPVVIADDSHNHVIGNIDNFTENVQDIVGGMVNPTNIESGIDVTYNDTTGKLNFNVNDPTFKLVGDVTSNTVTMENLQNVELTTTLNINSVHNKESVQDIVGGMVSSNTETGISVTYQDNDPETAATGKLNFAITADPKIVLGGDLSGNVTLTNCATGNYTLNAYIKSNSVALGTDTTGSYVKNGATSGNGLSGSVNSESGQFTVHSNATSSSTANTIVYRNASRDFSCNIMSGTATSAQWADLAEKYKSDAEYPVGTVISLGGSEEVTLSIDENDTKVIGVISEYPAYLMNSNLESEFTAIIALKGRVPVIVEGSVEKGDIIVSGGNGVGIVNNNPRAGSIIGKSLENSNSLDNRFIEVVIL